LTELYEAFARIEILVSDKGDCCAIYYTTVPQDKIARNTQNIRFAHGAGSKGIY